MTNRIARSGRKNFAQFIYTKQMPLRLLLITITEKMKDPQKRRTEKKSYFCCIP